MTRKLITGGPLSVQRGGETVEIEVDLHWFQSEGEPGSASITESWELCHVDAYDDTGEGVFLRGEELDEAMNLYPAK